MKFFGNKNGKLIYHVIKGDYLKIKKRRPKRGYHLTAQHKKKLSLSNLGKKLSKETRRKISLSKRGNTNRLGIQHTEKTKRLISLKLTGRKHSSATKRKMSIASMGNRRALGYHHTEDARGRIGKAQIGNTYNVGRVLTEEEKCNLRMKAVKHIKEKRGGFRANVGKNEKKILDFIESKIKFPIRRNYTIYGYFPDGYCEEINTIFEIDEKGHFKNLNFVRRDIRRQKNIMKKLNCNFVRINEKYFLKRFNL